ncbi:hypothetical protein B0H19DRAFT_592266 [Mycena capillaripes]|nr:hypothetical protein B0H19DRAFT_592266 [Mycena capillaripes]
MMFSSSILFASMAVLFTSASGLSIAHQPRTLIETQDLNMPVDPSCQSPCTGLSNSLTADTTEVFLSLLCSGLVLSQTTICYGCLADAGVPLSKLQAQADAFVADCTADGHRLNQVEIVPLSQLEAENESSGAAPSPTDGATNGGSSSSVPSPTDGATNGGSSSSVPSPTSGSDGKKSGGERLFVDARRVVLGVVVLSMLVAGL